MVFVGDSLNRNQWVSMVCLVESVVPAEHKTRTFNGSLMSFKVMVGALLAFRGYMEKGE